MSFLFLTLFLLTELVLTVAFIRGNGRFAEGLPLRRKLARTVVVPVILAAGYALRHGVDAGTVAFAAIIIAVWGGFVLTMHLIPREQTQTD